MIPQNRKKLEARVARAAYAALTEKGYVSAIDVLVGMQWLEPEHVVRWRKGQLDYLERVVHTNLNRINFAMDAFRRWAERTGLNASPTAYKKRGRVELRFSKSRSPRIEHQYRIHYVSPQLSKAKEKAKANAKTSEPDLDSKADKPREIVVFSIVRDTRCAGCDTRLGKGRFLFKENDKAWCMGCADLDHLVYLPAGSSKLTRRAKKYSPLSAVVVRFSRTRKRYERQGLLVESTALRRAEEECFREEELAERRRHDDLDRNSVYTDALVAALTAKIRAELPGCPEDNASAIAELAAYRTGKRIGRTAREPDLKTEELLEVEFSWIRIHHTEYDEYRMLGTERGLACEAVRDEANRVFREWQGPFDLPEAP